MSSDFLRKKVLSIPAAIVLMLIIALLSVGITYYACAPDDDEGSASAEGLYNSAISDAMLAEADELKPLVAITKDSDLVDWNESGDMVLVTTWNKYPDSYVPGTEVTLQWGEVWVFLDGELQDWCEEGNLDNQDETLRLEQLIGLPPQNGYTHFTSMWVSPEDLFRPCYDNEISDTSAELSFKDSADESYIDWFNGNIVSSYYPEAYPWTRLGYTYDWSGKGSEYGLSEFVVKADSEVIVEDTMTNDEFIEQLKAG